MILLFKMEGCPYCQKVINFLENKKIDYKPLDISDKLNKEELLNMGGKLQVPFLFDQKNEIGLYESDDIVQYLETL